MFEFIKKWYSGKEENICEHIHSTKISDIISVSGRTQEVYKCHDCNEVYFKNNKKITPYSPETEFRFFP